MTKTRKSLPACSLLLAVCFLSAGCVSPMRPSVEVTDLRCEYLTDPLGVDVAQPRLSWKLSARNPEYERGQRQTAYHVLVASSRALLDEDQGDLWDSGEVASDRSVLVEYAGKPLESWASCWWKVRVRDERDDLTPWGPVAHWTMGLLDPSLWKAEWIGSDREFQEVKELPPSDDALADPWLRKTFELGAEVRRAHLHVASVGYHELYVNGRKTGDTVLAPSVSDHNRRARYVTYDIQEHLKPGRNAIGLWLGASWSVFPLYRTDDKPQTPIVTAQGIFELADGTTVTIGTDDTWKTHPSPNYLLGTWMFRNFGGEYYDSEKEMDDWCSPGLDDSGWESATVYDPALELSAEMVPPNRRILALEPVSIREEPDGEFRVDMGRNFAGMVEIDIRGEPGTIVEFLFSEREEQLMTHKLHSACRIGPSGEGTFRNRFNYGVGRWIQIRGLQSAPAPEDIRGWLVRTDYDRAGQFRCSVDLLNDIHEITLWTFENLSLGAYVVDCPQRERMGYGGDAHATTRTALCHYDLGAFYTKWSQDWRDVQGNGPIWGLGETMDRLRAEGMGTPDYRGHLPYTAPTYWGGGGPAWSGFCVTLAWEVYLRYGDRRILEQNLDTIRKWLAFLEGKSSDDMLRRYGGQWDFLGDWLWPEVPSGTNGDTRETLFFNNCFWIHNLQTAARIADVLGEEALARSWRQRAGEVRKKVHAEFFDPAENGYVNNFQAYLAIALLVDLPPEDVRPAVWKRLEDEILIHRNGHFWGGITGGAFIVKTLLEHHRSDLLHVMATREDFPGWGHMLRQGATTLWEAWDGRNSRLHSSYLSIGAWFQEGLAGIRAEPEEPGFRRFSIRPHIPEDASLEWARALYESPYGQILSHWRRTDGSLTLEVTVPPNTTATVFVPTADPGSVRESGRSLDEAPGVRVLREEKAHQVVEVEPGRYRFEAAWKTP